MNIDQVQKMIRNFAIERDWEQFHTPRNLASALSVEASEILEHFQWLTDEDSQSLSPEKTNEVSHEMADVLYYLLRLADVLKIDLEKSLQTKMVLNAEKYPADKVRGSAKKYSEYDDRP